MNGPGAPQSSVHSEITLIFSVLLSAIIFVLSILNMTIHMIFFFPQPTSLLNCSPVDVRSVVGEDVEIFIVLIEIGIVEELIVLSESILLGFFQFIDFQYGGNSGGVVVRQYHHCFVVDEINVVNYGPGIF